MIREVASAKVNLYLHVGPRRADRLHEIDSLFAFAEAGDVVTVEAAEKLSLEISGPFAKSLAGEPIGKNLAMRAARLLQESAGVAAGARLVLDKRLPVASGVGGGSADAAAAIRALCRLWRLEMPVSALKRLAFSLGADVPACLSRRSVYVGGAGECVEKGPVLPPLWICLANPRVAMSTAAIFQAFDEQRPAPPRPDRVRLAGGSYRDVTALMENSRNDLEPIAIRRQSVIQIAIDRLAGRAGALAARMSGSGATVFGLYSSAAAADGAARDAAGQGWWSLSARLCGAEPRSPGAAR